MDSRKWAGLAAVAGILLLGALAFWWGSAPGPSSAPDREQGKGKIRKAAPNFTLRDVRNQKHSLDDLRGNIVIVHFWASWCPPCIEELPEFLTLVREWKGKPVKFLAISLDKTWADAHKILPEKDLPEGLISVLDPDMEVPEKYGSFQFPESYVVDPELRIAHKLVGAQDWKNQKLRDLILASDGVP